MASDTRTAPVDSSAAARALRGRTNELGVLVFMATVVMLFAAFTAAYMIRKSGSDWQPVPLPGILWASTALVLVSSITCELAKRQKSRNLLVVTALLGFAFLAMQLVAWSELRTQGVFLSSNPHSAFFYVLSAIHGLHLTGGLVLLCLLAAKRKSPRFAALYWHFMGGLWVYVFGVLSLL